MSFQAVPALGVYFLHIVFRGKRSPFSESIGFKKSGGSAAVIHGLIVSGLLFTGWASAQQRNIARNFAPRALMAEAAAHPTPNAQSNADTAEAPQISISIAGQAQPELNLEWQSPESSPEPISGYIVLRSTSAAGPFTALESSPQAQTSYLDSSVEDGSTYYYEVESVGRDDMTSVPTSAYELLAAIPVAFGNQTVASSSASQSIVVTNTGNATLTFDSIRLTGADGNQFPSSKTCGTTLAASHSCTINLRFYPTTAGAATAALVLTDNAGGFTQTIPLTGTGLSPGSTEPLHSMQFNGTTNLAGTTGSLLRLTEGGQNEAGSAFYKTPVNIQSFTNEFAFQLANPSAEGITFTIQNEGLTALGQNSEGLGYAGIGKSVAVKFDLYNNAGEGDNSTGVFTDGAQPTIPAIDLNNTGINLHSGDWILVQMAYNGSNLKVKIIDASTLATWSFTSTVDIPLKVGGNTAYVGFTGGTGTLTSSQKVGWWTYASGPNLLINYLHGFIGAN
jgi:hypothetical protein